jgi:DNA-binding transcriptional LysR family regulator
MNAHTLVHLEAFATVAETLNFSRAAARLGLTRSALSKQVAALETAVDARLLQRSTRAVSLTPAGQALLDHYQRARTTLLEGLDAVRGVTANVQGLVRLSAPPMLGARLLAPLMAEFQAQHPQVEIDLLLIERAVDLVGEGFDLALRITAQPPLSYVARTLMPITWHLCASPDYLARYGRPAVPEELANHSCLLLGHARGEPLILSSASHRRVPVPIRTPLRVSTAAAISELTRRGYGIGLLPNCLLFCQPEWGTELVEVLAGWQPQPVPGDQLRALYLPGRYLRVAARALLDFLVERLRGDPATVQPIR